jgi:hypothetical protein
MQFIYIITLCVVVCLSNRVNPTNLKGRIDVLEYINIKKNRSTTENEKWEFKDLRELIINEYVSMFRSLRYSVGGLASRKCNFL